MNRSSSTLLDLAKRAGVAKSTASMALRGDVRIRAETRLRVEQAARELNYQPDPVLSALSMRRHHDAPRSVFANLAVLVDDRWYEPNKERPAETIWCERVIEGIKAGCKRMGYEVSAFRIRRDLMSHKNPDRLFANRGIRGIILTTFQKGDLAVPLDLNRYSVIRAGNYPDRQFHRAGMDAFAAADLACGKLREVGYRRIGLAHGLETELRTGCGWLGCFAKEMVLQRQNMRFLPPFLPKGYPGKDFLAWVNKHRPEAIITNDMPFYRAIIEMGLRVPEDVGVAFLNQDFCDLPDAAGIAQHLDLMGEAAVEQLHLLLLKGERGLTSQPHETLIYPSWVDGKTIQKRNC